MFRLAVITALLLSLTSLSIASAADKNKYPPRFQAAMDYLLEKDYPELFADKPYRMRPTGFDIGDLDGDGVDEIVVSFNPHYLQSPTVMIFKVDNKMNVTRIKEGLAPGPLVPITNDFLDSHTLGQGIDMTLEKTKMAKPDAIEDFIAVTLNNMGGVVAYKNFFHMDGRKGKGMYIDMMHIANPPKDKTCDSFQFSEVRQIKIGRKKGEKSGYILAVVGDKAYIYQIKRFRSDGLIDKSLKIVPLSGDN